MRPLRSAQIVIALCVAGAFPAASAAVFVFDTDRTNTADVFALVYSLGLLALFSSVWWPLPSLSALSRRERLRITCFVWFAVTFTTHLTWELGWLLLRTRIQSSPDAFWAYPWWAYIDGGDARYAGNDPTLVVMETLSVLNGLVGVTGLWLWYRHRRLAATLAFMATAVVHLYSTSLYYGTEIIDGFPHVDTSSFIDTWVKFGLANGFWLVMPVLVLVWGAQLLRDALPAAPRHVMDRRPHRPRPGRAART